MWLGSKDLLMSEAIAKKFKVNDRVKRVSGGSGGIIKELRVETTSVSHREENDKNVLINVLWDNGTQSYFSPSALEIIKE